MSRQQAVHKAWLAGLVRLGGPIWVKPEKVDTTDHEMLAWCMANKSSHVAPIKWWDM
jgi:hypothetical protein